MGRIRVIRGWWLKKADSMIPPRISRQTISPVIKMGKIKAGEDLPGTEMMDFFLDKFLNISLGNQTYLGNN